VTGIIWASHVGSFVVMVVGGSIVVVDVDWCWLFGSRVKDI
jgi:hypothetical protein